MQLSPSFSPDNIIIQWKSNQRVIDLSYRLTPDAADIGLVQSDLVCCSRVHENRW